jgi:hypothetical protein
MSFRLSQSLHLMAALAACVGSASAASPALSQEFIAVGSQARGSLSQSDDEIPRGTYGDFFLIDGEAGVTVSITLRSRDFDAYLVVAGPDGGSSLRSMMMVPALGLTRS